MVAGPTLGGTAPNVDATPASVAISSARASSSHGADADISAVSGIVPDKFKGRTVYAGFNENWVVDAGAANNLCTPLLSDTEIWK